MSPESSVVERLRAAFAADDRGPEAGGTCPEPGELWDALHGLLEAEPARRIVQHLARCPSCAAEWRVGMTGGTSELAAKAAADRPAATRGRRRVLVGIAGAAAIAAGLAVVVIAPGLWQAERPAGFRGAEGAIRSLVPEDRALPREACVLRWSEVSPQARYSVHVTLPTLEPLVEAHGLELAEYTVPAGALAGLPPGATLVWRVEARLPDGGRVPSPAFVQRIE